MTYKNLLLLYGFVIITILSCIEVRDRYELPSDIAKQVKKLSQKTIKH